MMTAKALGKQQIVVFDENASERPVAARGSRDDIRSIAHLKMLQSLSGKLNRLNDVREIGMTVANELRQLIDYHNCRVLLLEDERLLPIAFRGELTGEPSAVMDVLVRRLGEGITGHVAKTGKPLITGDAANCEYGVRIAGTETIEESLIAVPLTYGSRVVGVSSSPSWVSTSSTRTIFACSRCSRVTPRLRSSTPSSTRPSAGRRRARRRCSSWHASSRR